VTNRSHDALLFASRLLLAAALLPTGIARAFNVSGFALTLAGAGMPMPNAVATAAVVIQVFGPLAVLLGVLPRISGLALAGFAGGMAVLLHPFWQFSGATFLTERALFLADLGLAGGFLIYALTGPGAWSWQGWRQGAVSPARPASGRGSKRPTPRKSARAAA